MVWYLTLKWLHIVAASLYVGVSTSNGLIKTRADKHDNAALSAFAMDLIGTQNRVILIPASTALLASGVLLANATSTSMIGGWLVHGLILFVALSFLLFISYRMEHQLLILAREANKQGNALPHDYWRLSRCWSVLGASATAMIGVMVLVMIAKWSLV